MSSQELPAVQKMEPPSSDTLTPSSPSRPAPGEQVPPPPSEAEPSSNTFHHSNQAEPARENLHMTALSLKRSNLAAKLEASQAERDVLVAQSTLPSGLPFPSDWTDEQRAKQALESANAVIKEHISLLHGYNEIKDIGQGLLGLVAEKRGVRVKDIMEEFGVGIND
ncbi:uncharacterized protein RCC_07172 [Ramularia collo-cygni]|uniref:DNA repair protein Swi5/Sae3 n=1 Tax=Ramularia collo-cygni TaxID=112498 RepID=A0A2D3VH99_9PEZI|nr:uncharacterized protein RCC_07172 [Ramularia collo-cygni]CZT21309.1 uncharacterized protein RCC_07172 [Ramularia collo-cygni]